MLSDLQDLIPKAYFIDGVDEFSKKEYQITDATKNHKQLSRDIKWGYLASKLGSELFFDSNKLMSARQVSASEILMHLGNLASAEVGGQLLQQANQKPNQFKDELIPTFQENLVLGLQSYLLHLDPNEVKPFESLLHGQSKGTEYGEIQPSSIDQFSKILEIRNNETEPPDISLMKSIPENDVKIAFAEILNEGVVPKDWGGEKSDLFTTNISINGKYRSSAFLLKGPAKFAPMKMTHLGKNGDQIDRLFTEPAEVLILQHCHSVETAVRSTMKAFARRDGDLRNFTIIDGYDTIRILTAYGKCGL